MITEPKLSDSELSYSIDVLEGAVPTHTGDPMTLAEAARVVREAVRDKSYQVTPKAKDTHRLVSDLALQSGERVISGDGGNRTHVRDRVKVASTSVAGTLISSLARLAGWVAGDQPPWVSPAWRRRTAPGEPAI